MNCGDYLTGYAIGFLTGGGIALVQYLDVGMYRRWWRESRVELAEANRRHLTALARAQEAEEALLSSRIHRTAAPSAPPESP